MRLDLLLRCESCGEAALADDEFCESCGTPLAIRRDAARHHVEIDSGVAAGVSDLGLAHRRNEDALFVEASGRSAVVVVCDGVSTAAAPEVAAEVAAEVAGHALHDAVAESDQRATGPDRRWDARSALAGAIAGADLAVRAVPWMPSGDRGAPSCTIVAAVWDGRDITVGWAGDSRAYWLGPEGCEQLTVDHSWAQEQVEAGVLTPELAGADGRAHAITRWLGADAPDDAPPVAVFTPFGPGRLILCSDGLWNYAATADELGALVSAQPAGAPAIELTRALARAALTRGGHDNVTVAVVDIEPAPGDGR